MTTPEKFDVDVQALITAYTDQRNNAQDEAAKFRAAYLTEAKAHEATLVEVNSLKDQIARLEQEVEYLHRQTAVTTRTDPDLQDSEETPEQAVLRQQFEDRGEFVPPPPEQPV